MVKIAVDAMGGDNAPGEIVAGAVMAAQSREDIQIFLIGKEEVVSEELKKHTYKKEQIEVVKSATKTQIKAAVEQIFQVKVDKVNTSNYDGKLKRMGRNEGRRSAFKKAIVTLTDDSKAIEFFESLA